VGLDSLFLRSAEQWAAIEVEVVTGERVVGVSPAERSLELASGGRVVADQVLLTTGGRNRTLGFPGERLPGVFQLRDAGHSTELGAALVAGASVVVIGGGFIGAEVAASARTLGCDVTIVEAGKVPLERGLGAEWGTFVADEHRRRGVRVVTGIGVRALLGEHRVSGVELADGSRLDADVVVVGVGMVPRTELAELMGLEVAGGIVVDAGARTSNPAVFAAGDVTVQPAWRGDGLVRLESYQNAQDQADVAAAAMLGQELPERDVPWFWSDQFDLNIQTAGHLSATGRVVVRGDREALSFTAFHVDGDRLAGALAVNRGKDVRAVMRLIAADVAVDDAALADESVDLRKLARAARTPL
jgi:3-phenylpropionate/trans-cinnamate dioxygenase ferredoxin reductase subunit